MKKLLLIPLILLIPMLSKAQLNMVPLIDKYLEKGYVFNDFDSAQYGSKEEYRIQLSANGAYKHGCFVLLAGYNVNYAEALSAYIQSFISKIDRTDDSKDGITTHYYSRGLKMIVKYNSNTMKTTSVTIAGNSNDVIDLFLNYWRDETIKISALKKGISIYQDNGTDRVFFEWQGANPIIRIVRNSKAMTIKFNS